MKKFTQGICILLIIALVFPMTAFASEIAEPRASNYFAAESCYLDKTSDTEFDVWFEATGVGTMDEIGASTVQIQRSTDGSNWTTVKTFSKASYSEMIDKNTTAHCCGLSYTGTKGYYYRAYVQFYAKKGTGSAVLDRYTSKIKL